MGIARSYQITNIFPDLTVHENIRVAAQALTVSYDIWRNRAPADANSMSRPMRRSRRVGLLAGATSWRKTWRMASSARWKSRWRWSREPRVAAARRADRRHGAGGNHGHDGR